MANKIVLIIYYPIIFLNWHIFYYCLIIFLFGNTMVYHPLIFRYLSLYVYLRIRGRTNVILVIIEWSQIAVYLVNCLTILYFKINILIYLYTHYYRRCPSTTLGTTLLLETIDYNRENTSDYFLLLIVTSKAFDRVEYVKWFQTQCDRKMWHTVLCICMSTRKFWNQTCDISNRAKQGGVLSPLIYSDYVDNLIRILRDEKIGCMYNN